MYLPRESWVRGQYVSKRRQLGLCLDMCQSREMNDECVIRDIGD